MKIETKFKLWAVGYYVVPALLIQKPEAILFWWAWLTLHLVLGWLERRRR